MARRYRRRHRYTIARPLKTTKYSNETYASLVDLVTNTLNTRSTASVYVIPDVLGGVLGTRKAKNFTLRICAQETRVIRESETGYKRSMIAFALVYLPEGNLPGSIQYGNGSTSQSLYEPNQNVILSGIVDSTQVYTFKTRLARNLNAGDNITIQFMDLTINDQDNQTILTPLAVTCNYAISF